MIWYVLIAAANSCSWSFLVVFWSWSPNMPYIILISKKDVSSNIGCSDACTCFRNLSNSTCRSSISNVKLSKLSLHELLQRLCMTGLACVCAKDQHMMLSWPGTSRKPRLLGVVEVAIAFIDWRVHCMFRIPRRVKLRLSLPCCQAPLAQVLRTRCK